MQSTVLSPSSVSVSKKTSEMNRACRTCARAKSKCMPGPTRNRCDRCHRLNKDCPPPALKNRRPRGPGKAATLLPALEQKVNDLVELVGARDARHSQEPRPSPGTSTSQPRAPSNARSRPSRSPLTPTSLPQSIDQPGSTNALPKADDPLSACSAHQENPFDFVPAKVDTYRGSLHVSDIEGQSYIDEYRQNLGLSFPFVQIPQDITAPYLRASKPMLFQALATVCSYCDHPRSKAMAQETLRQLSMRVYMEGEKSLDLLQACLVLTAWYHFFTFRNPQFTNLVHLAAALVVDLGLNQNTAMKEDRSIATFATRILHGRASAPTTRDDDERRALLGTYYLSSAISTTFIRFETLRFSSVMEDACTHFEEQSPRNPQNILAVKLTRLLHLSEGIATGMPVDPGLNPKDLSICPLSIYIKGSQANLDKFWELLPADMQDDVQLRFARRVAEVHLYYLAFRDPPAYLAKTVWSVRQIELLWKCVKAAKEVFNELQSLPPAYYFRLTAPAFTHFAWNLVILSKLASNGTLHDIVQKELSADLNLSRVFAGCAEVMERVPAEARFNHRPVGPNTIFVRWAWRLRIWQASCDRHEQRMAQRTAARAPPPAAFPAPPPPQAPAPPMMQMRAMSELSPMLDMGALDTQFPVFDDDFWQQLMQEQWPQMAQEQWPPLPPQVDMGHMYRM